MNTRHATPGTPMNPSRFASSPTIEQGLHGNLVALRCANVKSAEDRELLFWLQYLSQETGGLAAIAEEVRKRLLATRKNPTAVFDREEAEIEAKKSALDANYSKRNPDWLADREYEMQKCALAERALNLARRRHQWRDITANLLEKIACLSLDPGCDVSASILSPILRELKTEYTARTEAAFTHTALSRIVWRHLTDAYEYRGPVLMNNGGPNGKSFAARKFCEAFPSRARYVLTPANNTEVEFYRAIAKALGTASGCSFKPSQIRDRILRTLPGSGLVLVLDSAQWLFPTRDYRYALPDRVNFVLSDLCDNSVPVVLIADSCIFDAVGFVSARTGWSMEKFFGLFSNIIDLPPHLEKADVQAVAAAILPDGDRGAQRALADYMITAQGYLHAGPPAARRARQLATQNNRNQVTLSDMETALDIGLRPALKSAEAARARANAVAEKAGRRMRNWRPETPAQIEVKKGKRRNQIITSSDLQSTLVQPPQPGSRRAAFGLPAARSNSAVDEFPVAGLATV